MFARWITRGLKRILRLSAAQSKLRFYRISQGFNSGSVEPGLNLKLWLEPRCRWRWAGRGRNSRSSSAGCTSPPRSLPVWVYERRSRCCRRHATCHVHVFTWKTKGTREKRKTAQIFTWLGRDIPHVGWFLRRRGPPRCTGSDARLQSVWSSRLSDWRRPGPPRGRRSTLPVGGGRDTRVFYSRAVNHMITQYIHTHTHTRIDLSTHYEPRSVLHLLFFPDFWMRVWKR